MELTFEVFEADGTVRRIVLQGRNAWALSELIRAGQTGCTPISHPGPRWSGYVFNLRRHYGLNIETVHERHGPPFPGSHARYVLRSLVRALENDGGTRRVA